MTQFDISTIVMLGPLGSGKSSLANELVTTDRQKKEEPFPVEHGEHSNH